MIWKDVGFTYCFLFVASYLTYLTANKQQLSWEKISLLLLILLYGTAIKFQAKYCAPIILAHMAYILSNYQLCYKKIIKIYGLLLIGFYLCLNNINWILIPKVEKSHAWQLVKIYDLAVRMISLSGFIPHQEIKIVETGLRPGEKLYEELLNVKEQTLSTANSKIMVAKIRPQNYELAKAKINELMRDVDELDNWQLVTRLKQIVPEFKSKNSNFEEIDRILAS